jgi:hypothetical protein
MPLLQIGKTLIINTDHIIKVETYPAAKRPSLTIFMTDIGDRHSTNPQYAPTLRNVIHLYDAEATSTWSALSVLSVPSG